MHNAAAERRAAEWLRVELPDAALTRSFAWAELCLATATADSPDAVLALIAVGDFQRARTVLASYQSDHQFLDLYGRYFAATGDRAFAHAHWARVKSALQTSSDGIRADTLRDLAHVAEAIGEGRMASEVNRLAHGRRGQAERRWKLDHDETTTERWPDLPFAQIIIGFAYGVLGVSPDAARGRLRLRPRLPDTWDAASVHNINVGDARVRLDYARDSSGWQFELSQTAGAYPFRLIFEPVLHGLPKRALVDGRDAELDYVPLGHHVVAPVQIVLDERRTVQLRL
jgi:hypothetical protein